MIIPAHNEASVIARTLAPLAAAAASGALEVIVVCNACTDRTARDLAPPRSFAGVTVVEIAEASKTAALNAGDSGGRHLAAALPRRRRRRHGGRGLDPVLRRRHPRRAASPARPTAVYDATGADPLVRAPLLPRPARAPPRCTPRSGAPGGYAP